MGDADIRDVLDWSYYIERLGGTIQKIITIPAALQGLTNPVPRVLHPEWLHKRILEKNDVLKQRRINQIFAAKPKPVADAGEIRDIEDMMSEPSTSLGVPISTKRKRTQEPIVEEYEAPAAKTWKEALGNPPKLENSTEKIQAWIAFQKKKWVWQLAQRNRFKDKETGNKNKKSKVSRTETVAEPAVVTERRAATTLGGFLKRAQRSLIESPWQIIQIATVGEMGDFTLWAMVGDELHKIKLNVPRIFYVNQRSPAPTEPGSLWKKVHRVLPRARPVYHLYQYSVNEAVFRDNRLGMLADLATPDIEGIYETQMSLEFRALMDLGCICSVQRSEAKKLATMASKDIESFSLDQLQFQTQSYQPYLKDGGSLKRIFLYQHTSSTGKRELWGLFMPPIKKSIIIVLDTVRTNQMPTMRNFYATERTTAINSGQSQVTEENVPPEDMSFEVFMEIDPKQIYRHIQRMLTQYKDEKKGPTLLCLQTSVKQTKLNSAMPIMSDFPQACIYISDDASLLSGLEWQRSGTRAMIRHFLNLNTVIDLMLEQCRYFHLPIGNMPVDTVLFGADLFYARYLQKHNFVLWTSPNSRPDLGGREADDNRLLAEFEDNITVVQNKSGFYSDVCVELAIDSLAVSALLQANKVQEMEGASSAITFDVIPQVSRFVPNAEVKMVGTFRFDQ